MSDDDSYRLPARESLRCTICDKTTDCMREELELYIVDDTKWSHCCGLRMAVDFPDSKGDEDSAP